MYKAILFDLDGTLLPMDMEVFTKAYMKGISAKFVAMGIPLPAFVDTLWKGVGAMIRNDGKETNSVVFWECFRVAFGGDVKAYEREASPFYDNEFNELKKLTSPNPSAIKAVELARRNGRRVVLATNPIFPHNGQVTRMSWVGLKESDFDFITDCESDSFCKPNPMYYLSICERLGVKPEECLMIGNDESDDMKGASRAGMDCFLVTDCLIPCKDFEWQGERGSFKDLIKKLESL
ncbi:MAG: HAD family hydrolase [Ruminococcaceae bacterium]|nr:HAD family hydrolase [Oscillospiraceae bacterium]